MVFYTEPATELSHGKAASLVNSCLMHRKKSVPKMRAESRVAKPHAIGDRPPGLSAT